MRYKSKEESQLDHIENYRSDGVSKQKGHMYSSDFHRVSWIVENVPEDSYVLDVGCNTGTLSIPMTNKGCYVKGLDIVQELVDKAIKNGISAEQGEAEDLSRYKDEEFDAVVCCEVLEHLYDPLPAIKEAYRVLKPGGIYVVTVPHPNSQMAGEKLGDYHQQNFNMEILDTLFHYKFKRGNVTFAEIPYSEVWAVSNGYKEVPMGWLGLIAIK